MTSASGGGKALTADVVTARLRRMSDLSRDHVPEQGAVDMSPRAVSLRLLECAEISALACELARAGSRAAR